MKGMQKTKTVTKVTRTKEEVSPLCYLSFYLILILNTEHVNVIHAEQDDEPDMSDEDEYDCSFANHMMQN